MVAVGNSTVRIGTSGWNYRHWKGRFYPENLPMRRWLEFYAEHFDTVELNASFYRLPSEKTVKGWKTRTPADFLWSVKAPRKITHIARLRGVHEYLEEFLKRMELLEEKLGPVLFQLPPSLKYDHKVLEDFGHLVKKLRYPVLEVRNKSWLIDDCIETLKSCNIALCISHSSGRFPCFDEVLTANFVYIRFHGPDKLYASRYGDKRLEEWAEKIKAWNLPTFVYLNNDFEGYALEDAFTLKQLLSRQEVSCKSR